MKFFSLLALLLSTNLFADEPLNISISPDFTITIENSSEERIAIYRIQIESLKNEKWTNIRSDATCTCDAKCKKSPIVFKTKEIKIIGWDKKNNSCNLIKSDTYRVSIYGKDPIKKHTYKTLGTSSPIKYTGAQ